jgi:hypothetical protein
MYFILVGSYQSSCPDKLIDYIGIFIVLDLDIDSKDE